MVICDIDGCIFGNIQRAHLIPKDRSYTPNWTKFNEACVGDKPILAVINLVKHMADNGNNKILFVTSRGENVRQQTKEQLVGHFSDFRCDLIKKRQWHGSLNNPKIGKSQEQLVLHHE
jgi:hypothetical protein